MRLLLSRAKGTARIRKINGNFVNEFRQTPRRETADCYQPSVLRSNISNLSLPVAVAGADQVVNVGAQVQLNGFASYSA